jgi:gamma-glutamyltranspeptidase/glutathione hydrolase
VLVLYVVEPHACGPGGDAFLLVAEPGGDVEALDGSGAVPAGLTSAAIAADGLDNVPVRGGRSVTVPGAVGLLEEALRRYGTRTMVDLVGPALDLARDGFGVRRTLAETSARAATEIAKDPVLGPLYAPDGIPLKIGQVVKNRVLGNLLERLATEGTDEFYRGSIAEAIVARVQDDGGYLSFGDMEAYTTLAVQPQSAMFRGACVWELPLPTQGPAVLAALGAIEPEDASDHDLVLGAIRDGLRECGIDLDRRPSQPPAAAGPKDTTYLAVIDGEGRVASMITSIFADFGSHLGIAELGGPIHNRAATFFAMGLSPAPASRRTRPSRPSSPGRGRPSTRSALPGATSRHRCRSSC